jgi:hypothetical protein
VRCGRSACKITKINWKVGKETGGKKLDAPHALKANEMAEVVFEPCQPLVRRLWAFRRGWRSSALCCPGAWRRAPAMSLLRPLALTRPLSPQRWRQHPHPARPICRAHPSPALRSPSPHPDPTPVAHNPPKGGGPLQGVRGPVPHRFPGRQHRRHARQGAARPLLPPPPFL